MVIEDLDDDMRLYLGASRSAALLEVLSPVRTGLRARDPRHADAGEVPPPAPRRMTMAKKTHGRTRSGKPITDDLVEELAKQAEDGFDVDEILRRRGGRPPMGSAAASVESVRLDPELSEALRQRAEKEGRTSSDVIRTALRRYLKAG